MWRVPCAQVAVALQQSGGVVRTVLLLDPPPPGPCLTEFAEEVDFRAAAAVAVRAGQVAAGRSGKDAEIETIFSIFSPCTDLSQSAMVAVFELVKLPGQGFLASIEFKDAVVYTQRRIEIFLTHMHLWREQAVRPQPLQPGVVRMVTSTPANRCAFYGPVCGEDMCSAGQLQQYGEHVVAVEQDTEHAALYFRSVINQDARITKLLCDALRNMSRIA